MRPVHALKPMVGGEVMAIGSSFYNTALEEGVECANPFRKRLRVTRHYGQPNGALPCAAIGHPRGRYDRSCVVGRFRSLLPAAIDRWCRGVMDLATALQTARLELQLARCGCRDLDICRVVIIRPLFNMPRAMPDPLTQVSAPARGFWMVCRTVAAIVTVPISEELAYRGYLMRIFVSRNFDAVALRDVRWPALAFASIVFGITHGTMWAPGIIAGAAYGMLAIRTNKLGEAIAAHATTNALVAATVLIFDQWQLW